MRIEISDSEIFIPEWNKNKEQSAEEQISITYKTPNLSQRKRILPKSTVKFDYDPEGRPTGGSGEIDNDAEAAVRVVADSAVIRNLEYSKGSKTIEIRNVSELLAAPSQFYGLVKEFSDHLVVKAREDIPEKN